MLARSPLFSTMIEQSETQLHFEDPGFRDFGSKDSSVGLEMICIFFGLSFA